MNERKEGRTHEPMEGRNHRRTEEERTDQTTDGHIDGPTDGGRTDRTTDGQTDGQTDGRTDERTGGWKYGTRRVNREQTRPAMPLKNREKKKKSESRHPKKTNRQLRKFTVSLK